MGGASFLGKLLHALVSTEGMHDVRPVVLLRANRLPEPLRSQLTADYEVTAGEISADGTLRVLLEHLPKATRFVFYRDLANTIARVGLDLIGPTGDDLGTGLPVPWICYVPDFQHAHLPHFFTQSDRLVRDKSFRTALENCAGAFANSQTVVDDIRRFFPAVARSKALVRFPQVYPDVEFIEDADAVLAHHGIGEPYFLSCSQQWVHKQHDVIVRAFAKAQTLGLPVPGLLVLTGATGDYRRPNLSAELEVLIDQLGLRGRVRYVGMVDRGQQLALISRAHCLVQASLFEGGAGASGQLEAALLGTPILASDIAANRELDFGRMVFFPAHDVECLANSMGRVGPLGASARPPWFSAKARAALETAAGITFASTLRSFVARAEHGMAS
jgi:glycosyltransferase involved in cell wall biosynthesis